ncbi:MAG TPA: hypothetical protein VM901_00760 [Bdellovibrionota bacterium]|nr:hypothetical protein [Bdellovibrionota bacterium]
MDIRASQVVSTPPTAKCPQVLQLVELLQGFDAILQSGDLEAHYDALRKFPKEHRASILSQLRRMASETREPEDDAEVIRIHASEALYDLKDREGIAQVIAHPVERGIYESRQLVKMAVTLGVFPPEARARYGEILDRYPYLKLDAFGDMSGHPLYKSVVWPEFRADQSLPIRNFPKTGGKLFLLGGPLAGEVVARVMSSESAKLWRELYDDKATWRAAGFDEVPLEVPMSADEVATRYQLSGEQVAKLKSLEREAGPGSALVFAGVVKGHTLKTHVDQSPTPDGTDEWLAIGNRFLRVLEAKNIDFGHAAHLNNLVLEVYGREGDPILRLIDFDMLSRKSSP